MSKLPNDFKAWVDFYDYIIDRNEGIPKNKIIKVKQDTIRKKMDAEIITDKIETIHYRFEEIQANAWEELQEYRLKLKDVESLTNMIDSSRHHNLSLRNKVMALTYHLNVKKKLHNEN